MTQSLKLLIVFAHPDDESMGMGGTLAKYPAEGVETYYVCASRGERGWFGPKEENPGWERKIFSVGCTSTTGMVSISLEMKGIPQMEQKGGSIQRISERQFEQNPC